VDILDVIKQEHREVADMLDEADKCDPGDARLLELARKIEYSLSTHVKIEEKLFYSRLKQRARDEDERVDVFEAYTEHDVAGHIMLLLKSGRKPDDKFKAEMQVLGESVKHHVKEEESKVFSVARELIDADEREQLGEQWAKARKRADAAAGKPGARKKSSARKNTAKKSGARKTTARKTTVRKTSAKRTPAKKTTARKRR
jgi:hemerythrin-like domain-containing protein